MNDAGAGGPRPTRRALLGGVAGAAGTVALSSVPLAAATSHDLRVMTRNLYVGVDLFRLARAEDLDDLREIAGGLLAEARAHPYGARVEALAAEVAATEPDVLGVQEAALLRTREPSEFDGEHDPGAEDVLVDLLARFEDALAERGLEYEVATSVVTNDVEVPAATEDGDVDVRVTDRTAVLVRGDLQVEDARADRFEAAVPLPLDGYELSLQRGFCRVDLAVDGEQTTVATTHLEAFDPNVREEQAAALLDRLPTDRPVVLAGDVNSGPGGPSAAYDTLAGSFDDAVEAVGPAGDAHTCCFGADLRSDADALSRRVDVVLYRGRLRPTDVEVVGADPDSRVRLEEDEGGETVRLWPSDHAGVVASFELGVETGTADGTPAHTPTGTELEPVEQQPESQSGFGPLVAIVGAVGSAVAAAVRRRQRAD